jgi:threonine dehydrogenase-like Zn-dependent dehydrogenase
MMTNVRRLILVGGVILFAAGVIGLFVPVTISDGIGCGNAVQSDLSAAREQDNRNVGNSPIVQQIPVANQLAPKSEFVSSCNSALGNRRLWTIPLALVGVAGVGWAIAQRRDNSAAAI